MPNGNLQLASKIMRHYGNAGEYGVTVYVPWDGASEPPSAAASCILVHAGKEYPLALGEVLATYSVAKNGVEAFERLRPRTGFRIRETTPPAAQDHINLLYKMLKHWTVRPMEERVRGAPG
jgi:hypothetical protein